MTPVPDDAALLQLAEAHLEGAMPAGEAGALDARCAADPVFAAQFAEAVAFVQATASAGAQRRFRQMLSSVESDVRKEAAASPPSKARIMPLRAHYLRTAAVAACVALITSTLAVWTAQRAAPKVSTSQYSLLRRQLEEVKRNQNALVNAHNQVVQNLNDKVGTSPVPPAADFSGTGFALTADGYLATAYHVVEGADSMYIQTRDGRYHRARLAAADQTADVAVLKIESPAFRFGPGTDLPYAVAGRRAGLGARVYTLGFPQDEVVYSEGYIAAKNGYHGDSLQYRLELPAQPGQSGAPVVDARGSVVALISGRETNGGGTTYAVSTAPLLRLLATLPADAGVQLPKAAGAALSRLPREAQIDKLEDYICIVRVYGK